MDEQVRLHRFIAQCGVCSRRKAEEIIQQGRVEVNGKLIIEMGVKVSPTDEVRLDGEVLVLPRTITVLMNKPRGVVTTMSDPEHRPTVAGLLPDMGVTLKPVGRLDMDTEGLLIFTNDGDLASRLSHPKYKVEKEYEAIVNGIPSEAALHSLRRGVFIDGRRTAPAEVTLHPSGKRRDTSKLTMVLHEGRYRQVRLMCETVGHPVVNLKRVRIGFLKVKGMSPGQCITLGRAEVDKLRNMVGL
jgi:pseudouridine synthase